MAQTKAEALLVDAGPSLRYFTGLSWGASERLVAMLLLPEGDPVLVAPRFELGSLEAELQVPAQIHGWEEHENPHLILASLLESARVRHLAIDPALPFVMIERLRRAAPAVALSEASTIIDGCRSIKSPPSWRSCSRPRP
jgi:Xaa-Pro dipeptidase